MATAYTTRYGNAKTGVMSPPEELSSLEGCSFDDSTMLMDGGSIDLVPSTPTTGSGSDANASSPDEVSRVICRTG